MEENNEQINSEKDTKPDIIAPEGEKPEAFKPIEFLLSKEEIYKVIGEYSTHTYNLPKENRKIAFLAELDIHGIFVGFRIRVEPKDSEDGKMEENRE